MPPAHEQSPCPHPLCRKVLRGSSWRAPMIPSCLHVAWLLRACPPVCTHWRSPFYLCPLHGPSLPRSGFVAQLLARSEAAIRPHGPPGHVVLSYVPFPPEAPEARADHLGRWGRQQEATAGSYRRAHSHQGVTAGQRSEATSICAGQGRAAGGGMGQGLLRVRGPGTWPRDRGLEAPKARADHLGRSAGAGHAAPGGRCRVGALDHIRWGRRLAPGGVCRLIPVHLIGRPLSSLR